MGKRIMLVEGLDGQVELMVDRVVIHRQGLWNMFKYGMNARREIPLGAISEVVFKDATRFSFGSVDFVRSGAPMMSGGGGGGILGKKKTSMTAVKFKRDKQQPFEALKEKVFEMIENHAKTHH